MANAKGEWGMSKRGTWNGEWTKRKGEAKGKRTKVQKRNGQGAKGKGRNQRVEGGKRKRRSAKGERANGKDKG